MEEWSTQETAPVPESVPERLVIVVYGTDPAFPQYAVFHDADEAAKDFQGRSNAFGYFIAVPVRMMLTE
jgi:hypothetical protein